MHAADLLIVSKRKIVSTKFGWPDWGTGADGTHSTVHVCMTAWRIRMWTHVEYELMPFHRNDISFLLLLWAQPTAVCTTGIMDKLDIGARGNSVVETAEECSPKWKCRTIDAVCTVSISRVHLNFDGWSSGARRQLYTLALLQSISAWIRAQNTQIPLYLLVHRTLFITDLFNKQKSAKWLIAASVRQCVNANANFTSSNLCK